MTYQEQDEFEAQFKRATVPAIAAALGDYHVVPDTDTARGEAISDGVRCFVVALDWRRMERVEIGCRFPHDLCGHFRGQDFDISTITAAASKSPAQIAADIKRRLFPVFDEVHAAASANLAKFQAMRADTAATAHDLHTASGGILRVQPARDEYTTMCSVYSHEPWVSMQVSLDSIGAEFHNLTRSQAAALAYVLASHPAFAATESHLKACPTFKRAAPSATDTGLFASE